MDFSEVIEQLRILNGYAEEISRGQIDLIQITVDLVERIDALTGTVADGISTDIQIARDEAKRERLNALKDSAPPAAAQRREQRQMDGLLTSLVTGIATTGALIYGAIAGIALAGTRFTSALDGARESTIELVSGVRGMFGTLAMLTKQFRAFAMLSAIVATLPVSVPLILTDWVSRLFKRGGVVTQAINGFLNGIARLFSSVGSNIMRIPGARRLGSFLHGIGRVFMAIMRFIGGVAGFVIPFGGVLMRITGVLFRTAGRFSGILTIVMVLVDAIRGAFRGWQETGTIIGAVRGALLGVVEGFSNLFRDMGVFLDWLVTGVVNLIPFFNSSQATAAGDAVRAVFDALADWTTRIGEFFTDITIALGRYFLNPSSVIEDMLAFVDNMNDSVISYMGTVIDNVVQSITGFLSNMVRAVANRLPDWAPGKNSLLAMATSIDAMASPTTSPSNSTPTSSTPSTSQSTPTVTPTSPTAHQASNIGMRPAHRAQMVAINAPTVNQTNVQTNNRQSTVVSAPPAVRDNRWATIR